MAQEKDSLAAILQGRLRALDRRDLLLMLLNFLVTLLLAAGVLNLLFPKIAQRFVESAAITRYLNQSLPGLVGLAILLNVLVLWGRRALRKARAEVVDEVAGRDTTEKLALVDALTGMFNRRYMDDIIPREVSRAERHETSLSFVKIDVDNFKAVNARLGEQVGDRVLQEVAQLLKRAFRPTDIIIRHAADDFFIIMPETSKHGALVACRRMLSKVDQWNHRKPIPGYVMALNIGVADYSKGADIRDVLAAADHRVELYRDTEALSA